MNYDTGLTAHASDQDPTLAQVFPGLWVRADPVCLTLLEPRTEAVLPSYSLFAGAVLQEARGRAPELDVRGHLAQDDLSDVEPKAGPLWGVRSSYWLVLLPRRLLRQNIPSTDHRTLRLQRPSWHVLLRESSRLLFRQYAKTLRMDSWLSWMNPACLEHTGATGFIQQQQALNKLLTTGSEHGQKPTSQTNKSERNRTNRRFFGPDIGLLSGCYGSREE